MQEETPFICLDGKYKEVFSQDALWNWDVVTILSPGNETIEVSKLIKN